MTLIILGAIGVFLIGVFWLTRPERCPYCKSLNTKFDWDYGRTYCQDCNKRVS